MGCIKCVARLKMNWPKEWLLSKCMKHLYTWPVDNHLYCCPGPTNIGGGLPFLSFGSLLLQRKDWASILHFCTTICIPRNFLAVNRKVHFLFAKTLFISTLGLLIKHSNFFHFISLVFLWMELNSMPFQWYTLIRTIHLGEVLI